LRPTTKSPPPETVLVYDRMKVRFAAEALVHIAGIRFYIGGRSPQAATHIVERIFSEADRLGEIPQLGHIGTVPGTHEWIVPRLPYIIVYELNEAADEIVVLGVFHGAQVRKHRRAERLV
jgi:toxin ParE1/3/4